MTRPHLIRPENFGVFDTQNESLLAKQTPIDAVFIGDSITDLWAIDAYFRGTQGILVNRGISGDITPNVRKRFMADVVQLRPRLVVLMIGVNNFWDLDVWQAGNALPVRSAQAIEEGIIDDISAMAKDALTHSIEVVLSSILPPNIPSSSNNTIRNAAIGRVNERLQHIAHELQHVVFVNYHSHFTAEDGITLRDGLADDGLHPHSVGYEIMANVLLDTLKEVHVGIIKARQ